MATTPAKQENVVRSELKRVARELWMLWMRLYAVTRPIVSWPRSFRIPSRERQQRADQVAVLYAFPLRIYTEQHSPLESENEHLVGSELGPLAATPLRRVCQRDATWTNSYRIYPLRGETLVADPCTLKPWMLKPCALTAVGSENLDAASRRADADRGPCSTLGAPPRSPCTCDAARQVTARSRPFFGRF